MLPLCSAGIQTCRVCHISSRCRTNIPPASFCSVLPALAPPGKLPLMEIVFLLERQEHHPHESYRSISFNSVYGMPLKGEA